MCESNNVTFPFILTGYVHQQKFLSNKNIFGKNKQTAVRTYFQRGGLFVKGIFAGCVTVRENAHAAQGALATSPFRSLRSLPGFCNRVYPAACAACSFPH